MTKTTKAAKDPQISVDMATESDVHVETIVISRTQDGKSLPVEESAKVWGEARSIKQDFESPGKVLNFLASQDVPDHVLGQLTRYLAEFDELTTWKGYATCPSCGYDRHCVSHLKKSSVSWTCDKCRKAVDIDIINRKVKAIANREGPDKAYHVLRCGSMIWIRESFAGDSSDYFYESHTCPSNLLDGAELVFDQESMEEDPHGIIQYLGALPYDPKEIEIKHVHPGEIRTHILNMIDTYEPYEW